MSANAFGSDWARMESNYYRMCDPLNTDPERRLIPLRLDDAEIKSALNQFAYIDWREREEEQYQKLLKAYGGVVKEKTEEAEAAMPAHDPPLPKAIATPAPECRILSLGHTNWIPELSKTNLESQIKYSQNVRELE